MVLYPTSAETDENPLEWHQQNFSDLLGIETIVTDTLESIVDLLLEYAVCRIVPGQQVGGFVFRVGRPGVDGCCELAHL